MKKEEFIKEYKKYFDKTILLNEDIKLIIKEKDLDKLVNDNNAPFIDMVLKNLDKCYMKKKLEKFYVFIVFDFGSIDYVIELKKFEDDLYHITDFFPAEKKD